jgi:hypothetical protein
MVVAVPFLDVHTPPVLNLLRLLDGAENTLAYSSDLVNNKVRRRVGPGGLRLLEV